MSAVEDFVHWLLFGIPLAPDKVRRAREFISLILEEDRKGRELSVEKVQELRSQISHLRSRWDQNIDPSVGEKDLLFQALEALFAAIDFRDALINDLRQDSTAYQRGVEDGRKEIIRRLGFKATNPVELIKELGLVVKEFWK